ncbi:MAG TPA: hypothetical protein VFF13_06485 [archaeon]|nr:hypothetical protein [archaeon]
MYSKTVEKEDVYSKKEIADIKRVLAKGHMMYKKDPEFRKFIRAFIKETT